MDLVWGIYGIETPETEYRFSPPRKWRFDYCWRNHLIGVEIEGGVGTGGRHTRGSGFVRDMEKYNAAARLGFRVFRFVPKELKTGIAQAYMLEVFKNA